MSSLDRAERLGYERRILAAEVETVRLARKTKRFAEMIERNTKTLDAALILANFDADKRGHDRLVVEPWMPALLSLMDDLAQVLPESGNQNELLSEKQPKSIAPEVLDAAMRAFGDTEIVGGPPSFTARAVANAVCAALASVGRNAERQDRNGLGPKDEHAVPRADEADAQP